MEDTALFSAKCNLGSSHEPKVKEVTAYPMILGTKEIIDLWVKLNKFPILFATPADTTFENFLRLVHDPHIPFIDFDGTGMGIVTDIVPGIEARFQISFWDSRLKGREPLIRAFIRWIFHTFGVRRVGFTVRGDARAMRAFIERVGLNFEGCLKSWMERENKEFDLYLYGVTKREADYLWMQGRSWAKPRVKRLEIYEVK